MGSRQSIIMNNLEEIFNENQESKMDFMMLYSIVEKNKNSVDEILKLEDNEMIEVEAKNLKDFFTDYKILSAILAQNIATKITGEEQKALKEKLHLDFEYIEKETEQPRISMLMAYNYFLENNPDLIDSKMEKFLYHLEHGQGDNSALAFEDLNEKQRNSIPEELQLWIAKNTIFN